MHFFQKDFLSNKRDADNVAPMNLLQWPELQKSCIFLHLYILEVRKYIVELYPLTQ